MEQLLIRNVDDDLKRSIKRAALKNGRSMQSEVLDTLKRSYGSSDDDLLQILSQLREDLGGSELERPERSAPRPAPELG